MKKKFPQKHIFLQDFLIQDEKKNHYVPTAW